MKYKGIIFDLDGVICSTDEYHYQAWKKMASRYEIYFDREINNRLRGVSRMASLDIVLERYQGGELTLRRKQDMAEEKNRIYCELLKRMSEKDLSDEVRGTLIELRRRGYKLAIGSSSKNAKTILGRIGLGDFFDAVSDGTNITRSKPDPEVFQKAADFLGLENKDCLVVEDARAGIDAANASGSRSCAIGDASSYEKLWRPSCRSAGGSDTLVL